MGPALFEEEGAYVSDEEAEEEGGLCEGKEEGETVTGGKSESYFRTPPPKTRM